MGAGLAKFLVDGLACGIGDRALGIRRFHLIVGERIDEELLTHVLEEVFLAPAFKHAGKRRRYRRAAFLQSRGIVLPSGSPAESPTTESVLRLGKLKEEPNYGDS